MQEMRVGPSERRTVCASRANLRSRSRSAVGSYAVSVKLEPVEEHKESGIILDLNSLRAAPE